MVVPAAGEVVSVLFPFSDLSQSKLRPAVCLAAAGRNDWVLCQITSNAYSDPKAVELDQSDFDSGGLRFTSYARPGKLFTANHRLISSSIGRLNDVANRRIVDAVIALFSASRP